MNYFILCFALVSVILTNAEARTPKPEDSIDFQPDTVLLKTGVIQYYYDFQTADANPISTNTQKLDGLDIKQVLSGPESSKYYIQMGKVAYVVKQPITFFTEAKFCSDSYLKSVYQDLDLSQIKPCQYKIESKFPSPGLTMDLTRYDNSSSNPASRNLLNMDPGLGTPAVSLLEYGHDFSKIMTQKSVLSTSIFINYYPINEGETLIVSHSLSFIYNIPPKVLGGVEVLKKKFIEQITPIAERIEEMKN